MKILIVSDTHGRDENLEKAVYREEPFDYLIHCGDVEGREIFIEALVDCPCCIVSGNNDFFSDLPREEIIDLAEEENDVVTADIFTGYLNNYEKTMWMLKIIRQLLKIT